jgi:hypothetical protein
MPSLALGSRAGVRRITVHLWLAAAYGKYCWAILVTWSCVTVIKNGGLPRVREVAGELGQSHRDVLGELPLDWAASTFTAIRASARTGGVRSSNLGRMPKCLTWKQALAGTSSTGRLGPNTYTPMGPLEGYLARSRPTPKVIKAAATSTAPAMVGRVPTEVFPTAHLPIASWSGSIPELSPTSLEVRPCPEYGYRFLLGHHRNSSGSGTIRKALWRS